jgi:hypothetical protein
MAIKMIHAFCEERGLSFNYQDDQTPMDQQGVTR